MSEAAQGAGYDYTPPIARLWLALSGASHERKPLLRSAIRGWDMGFSFGSAIAISYSSNHSIFRANIHGILGP